MGCKGAATEAEGPVTGTLHVGNEHNGGLDGGGGGGGREEGTLEGEWTGDSGTQNKTWVLNFGVTCELVRDKSRRLALKLRVWGQPSGFSQAFQVFLRASQV